MLTCVRWHVASTVNRWVISYSLQLEESIHRRKRPVWLRWRMDETYIRVKGQWYHLYCTVDKTGQTIDFLITTQRDEPAATRALSKAIRRHGGPETMTIAGMEANIAAIRGYNAAHGTAHAIRQVKYLNNILDQDHRAVDGVTRPMLGCNSLDAAQVTLAGIELMHILGKQLMMVEAGDESLTVAQQFYALVAYDPGRMASWLSA